MTNYEYQENWQEEIASLQQDLEHEISKALGDSELNIRKHIYINNLKSKLERIKEIKKILNIDKYKIVFIGTIGKGKTTAICHLFNLISDFKVSKTIGGKSKDVIETKGLLSTGSGRTTICEVVLKASEKTYIEIDPYTVDEMKNHILEFCDYIANQDNSEEKTIISQEVERAIRNITDLKKTSRTVYDGTTRNILRTDPAQEWFDEFGLEGLKEIALNAANLEFRTNTKIEFDNQSNEQEWIKETFDKINSVELK